jgi:hypothetical protein
MSNHQSGEKAMKAAMDLRLGLVREYIAEGLPVSAGYEARQLATAAFHINPELREKADTR